MIAYSVIIPVYKTTAHLPVLVQAIRDVFLKLNRSFEVILVNDNPDYPNHLVIDPLLSAYPGQLHCITLTRNYGQHNAIICGFGKASGEFVITMDDDGQHRPEDIPVLIEQQATANYDVVYGKYETRRHSLLRNFSSSAIKLLCKIGIPDLHPDYTSFRLLRTGIAKEMLSMNNSYTFLDGYISWITTHVSSVNVKHLERQEGVSNYTIGKLLSHGITILFTFSALPIRLVTYLSLLICSSAFTYALYVLIRKEVLNDFQQGFPTMAIFLAFGMGLILLTLSIIGEYVFRVHLKTTRKPNFIIKNTQP